MDGVGDVHLLDFEDAALFPAPRDLVVLERAVGQVSFQSVLSGYEKAGGVVSNDLRWWRVLLALQDFALVSVVRWARDGGRKLPPMDVENCVGIKALLVDQIAALRDGWSCASLLCGKLCQNPLISEEYETFLSYFQFQHQFLGVLMERIGLYPGTFDPMTNGHLDIIQRGAKLVDRLVIGVAINDGKGPLFSLEERTEMVLAETKELSGTGGRGVIEAVPFTGLLMHFAEEMGASVIIRGLRAVADFEYEFQMAAMNQKLSSKVETVFLMAEPSKQAIASRLVKEIAQLDGKVSDFLPPRIEKRLLEKVRNG